MALKRNLDEFESDLGSPSLSRNLPSSVDPENDSAPRPNLDPLTMFAHTRTHTQPDFTEPQADDWQVAESKKSKKKKKYAAQQEGEDAGPALRFSTSVSSPLRIKDLQGLALYVLANGVAPGWVAVRQAKKIEKVVVLLVAGMDKAVLESFVAQTSVDLGSSPLESTETIEALKPDSATNLYLIPVKSPGDKNTGKIYSPIQAMLISPEEKQKSASHVKQEAYQPVQTPITDFIHTADELLSAEYPVHYSLFTNPKDALLEQERREATGQSSKYGWLDTDVTRSVPNTTSHADDRNPIPQGLDIYAIDCEMVLTTDDKYSLARVSILNWQGKTILDKYVKPMMEVKNYYTQFSGITPEILKGVTTTLGDIQKQLVPLFTSKAVLLGHSLESDLNALKLTHPFLVDTSLIYPHPRGLPLRSSLKFLANKYLKREIQKGGADGHDSVEDARAALDLVRLKCEKGPKWGAVDANGESIFSRLARSGHTSAMIDCGDPEKGFGKCANVKIGAETDDEVAAAVVNAVNDESNQVAFVWGRLRDLENARGWNSARNQYTGPGLVATTNGVPQDLDWNKEKKDGEAGVSADNADEAAVSLNAVEQASKATILRLKSIYASLPDRTLFLVYPGPGDMKEVVRLQEMQKQFKQEFKVKKWDELSVQWTDNEAQALRKAFQEARQGWALVGLK